MTQVLIRYWPVFVGLGVGVFIMHEAGMLGQVLADLRTLATLGR